MTTAYTQTAGATRGPAANVIPLFGHKTAMRALSQRAASGLAPPPTEAQSAWLVHGLEMPAGKLPLFDTDGQRIDERTVRCCLRRGWVEPWFNVPAVPDWLVCKLTPKGREIMAGRAG